MANASLGHALRAGLFVVFVGYVYGARLAPYRDVPFEDAETTVRAANAGLAFQLAYPSSDGTPPVIKRMSEVNGDYGIQLIVSLTGSAGRMLFGSSFQLRTQVARVIVFLLFVVTAAAVLAPPVPLLVSIAGVLSLWALLLWGTLGITDARHWGVAYAAVVGSVYLGTVLNAWTRTRAAALLLLALLAGYAQLLRQEAAPTTYALGLALLAAAGVTWLAGHSTRPRAASLMAGHRLATWEMSARSSVVARRALAGGLLLTFVNAAIVPLERLCFSVAWGQRFSETAMSEHGVGWPLYLSLGYASNPYNIGWRDSIGQLHAQLITPGLNFTDAAFQPTLLREYERIVISRPWLLVRNLSARAARVHELARAPSGGGMTPTAVAQSRPLAYAYWATPWVLLVTLALLVWRGTAEGAIVWFSAIALAAGASAGALMVFPEYIGGLQGSLVALLFVVPAVIAGSLRDSTREAAGSSEQLARRVLGGHLLVLVVFGGMAAIFVGVQAWRYRALQAATLEGDPVAAINDQQFRYAHVFNDLSVGSQGRLLARLHASTDPSVAPVIEETHGDLNLFRPAVVVRTASQVHVIAWMGRGFVPPVPSLFQGSTHASVLICGGCPADVSVNDPQAGVSWTMINDLEWQGRYRMYSLPIAPSLKSAVFFRVIAERTLTLDYSLRTWLVPQLIAAAKVTFRPLADDFAK